MPKYITRKEIAELLECSVKFIQRNEKRLGLDRLRCDLTANSARYFRGAVLGELLRRGLIEPD